MAVSELVVVRRAAPVVQTRKTAGQRTYDWLASLGLSRTWIDGYIARLALGRPLVRQQITSSSCQLSVRLPVRSSTVPSFPAALRCSTARTRALLPSRAPVDIRTVLGAVLSVFC